MFRSWRRIIRDVKALVDAMNRHDLGSYAAALSYNFIFALFPLLLFVSAGLSLMRLPLREIMLGPASALVPASTWQLVLGAVQDALRHRSPEAFWLGALGFLWGMSGAFRQFMDAANHAYGFPWPWRRSVVVFYLISFGLSLTVGLGVIGGIALSVTGPDVLRRLLWHGMGTPPQLVLVDGVRWVTLLALFLVLLSVLFWIAPDRPPRFRLFSPGVLLVLVGWLVLSSAFSYYAGHLARYNLVYGTLGNIILLLLYLYLFGLLLLLGVQVNAYGETGEGGGGHGSGSGGRGPRGPGPR